MNWLKLFDWTPVSVKVPYPRFIRSKNRGGGRFLLGYVVDIEYLYHGTRSVFFPTHDAIDAERRGRAALASAIKLYRKTRNQISVNRNQR